jgi:hypothetical protein
MPAMAVMATESPFLLAFPAYVVIVAMIATLHASSRKGKLEGISR